MIMDVVSNFNKFFKEDYYCVKESPTVLELVEGKGKPYKVSLKITRSDSEFLIIKDIEKLKIQDATYIKQSPKDCDYIVIDLMKQVIFLIELKDTDITNTEMMKQLIAGEQWLRHILFCCQCEEEIDFSEWEIRRVGIRYLDVRPPKKERPHKSRGNIIYLDDILGFPYFKLRGKEFNLDSIYPV